MPIYNYQAKNQHAETIKGKVEARTVNQAAQILRSRGLLVIGITKPGDEAFAALSRMFSGVKQDDVVTFTRQLSTMITAGLPLTQALSILTLQSKPALATVVSDIQREIEGGSSFTKALEKFPNVFPRIYVQLVKAGEVGGVIDDVLNRLAENMEKDKQFRATTKGALIYPAIVIVAMLVVATVMMIFVIPELTKMYSDFGAKLPLPTQILIDVSGFMAKFWWLIGLIGVGGFFGYKQLMKTRRAQILYDKFLLSLPVIGVLRAKIILTEFTRTMSLLLSSGISLLQALEIVSGASNSLLYREAFLDSAKQIEKGIALSQALGHYTFFPPILPQMIAVGEETGKLDEVLLKLSVYFQSESEQAVKNLTAAIEPLIMIVLGIGVGFLVIAIILPIYNLTSQF